VETSHWARYRDLLFRSAIRAALPATQERKPLDSADWVPLAHAEGADAPYPDAEKFTHERLAHAASAYDPRKQRAPIIRTGTGRVMDAHDAGMGKSRAKADVLGWVDGLRMNGGVMEGKLTEIADRCRACRGDDPSCTACRGTGYAGRLGGAIADGHQKRSAWISMNHPQFDKQPYLRHLAVGYDGEGQNYLPKLGDFIPAARALDDAEGVIHACRAIPAEPEDQAMLSKEEMEALVKEAVRGAREAAAAESKELFGTSLKAALEEALKPIGLQIAAATTKAEEAVESARAIREQAADATLVNRIDGAVKQGRMLPKDRDLQLELVRGLKTPELQEKALVAIESRRSMLTDRGAYQPAEAEDANLPEVDFGLAAGLAADFRPASGEAWIEAARGIKNPDGKPATADQTLAAVMSANPNPFALWGTRCPFNDAN